MKKKQTKNKSQNLVSPLKTYNNVKENKSTILKENKQKSGIYCFINKVNNKKYVGSAINLKTRFYVYYSRKRLNNSKMIIYKALLKYDHENFKLEILEYCEPEKCLERENYYLKLLKPKYNILQKARSSRGYKHTPESLIKMRDKRKNLSEEARKKYFKSYSNAEAEKAQILLDNKNKAGIYMWKNTLNKKCYIGSAENLSDRLSFYYSNLSMKSLLKRSQSHICSAILKHDRSNFSLEILEYCEPSKCLER